MSNKSYYKGTFDEVHIPEALLGKVVNMDMDKTKKRKTNKLRVALAGVAAFALCMIVSNGICFAATGETWVSKVIMTINGEDVEQEVTWHQEGDVIVGELEYELENEEDEISITMQGQVVGDDMEMELSNNEDDIKAEIYDNGDYISAEVDTEAGKTYFLVGESKIDITDDIADGKASGELDYDGQRFGYEIIQYGDDYEIALYTIGE
ncbi:MAG: hypothetical protein NC393_05825 [Clostridium sp.]|nr:hypothetical protein [Clostridium sp.]MCM1171632.1 hypothetical protein [Clostridium sp.]MCM1207891.1 hypothetical protein [Ruminococcus sp.]